MNERCVNRILPISNAGVLSYYFHTALAEEMFIWSFLIRSLHCQGFVTVSSKGTLCFLTQDGEVCSFPVNELQFLSYDV